MNTFDRYILKQLISVTLMGVISLSTLLLLGQIFKEVQYLLVESGAPPIIVVEFILQVIPFSLSFSVPWGFLTAVLLVYGRLAADNELSSMRMAGVSLWRLSRPAILLGIILSGVCYYINIEIAPRGKQAISDLLIRAAMENPKNLLSSGQSSTRIGNSQLYIEEREGELIKGLHIYPIGEGEGGFSSMHAQEAKIGHFDEKSRTLHLSLKNVSIERKVGDATDIPLIGSMPMKINIPTNSYRRLKANRFTNHEINEILLYKEITNQINLDLLNSNIDMLEASTPIPAARQLWLFTNDDARYYSSMNQKTERSFRTEGTQRVSFAFACIIFSLIGVPLAITSRRRDSSAGFAIGILVATLYFMALILCGISRKSGGIAPYIILWLPNIIGVIFAIWLHNRAKYRG